MFNDESRQRYDMMASSLPKVLMLHAWQERLALPALVEKVITSCLKFGVDTLVIENKAHGHAVVQTIREMLARRPFSVSMFEPRNYGDKSARLYSIQHLFSEGVVYAPGEYVGPDEVWAWKVWADMVIRNVSAFPRGATDDLTDTVSMALQFLRQRGFAPRKEDAVAGSVNAVRHKSLSRPLYDV